MEDAFVKRRFLWGLLLAWAPWIPTLIGFGYAFIGINNSKATGLAVVAGGAAELLAVWGLLTMVVSQVIAIVWLFRSFSRDGGLRNFVATVSIGLSGLTRLLVSFIVWMVWSWRRHG